MEERPIMQDHFEKEIKKVNSLFNQKKFTDAFCQLLGTVQIMKGSYCCTAARHASCGPSYDNVTLHKAALHTPPKSVCVE